VKVCSLYGAGFWYVPGTDTCIKLGSYLRVEVTENEGDGGVPLGTGSQVAAGLNTRNVSNLNYRYRFHLSTDIRTQTEYGTLRSYADIGSQWTSTGTFGGSQGGLNTTFNNNNIDVERAFIQFAGLTAGRIRSFFDIVSIGPYTLSNTRLTGDSSPTGTFGIGYTWQFGNGISASLSLQDGGTMSPFPGRTTINAASNGFGGTALGSSQSVDNKGNQMLDPVVGLRIDQAWGYASVTGALHDVSGGYYTNIGTLTQATGGCVANTVTCGHAGDAWGYAVGAGFTLNDFLGLKGDTFGAVFVYGHGAAAYVTKATGTWTQVGAGNKLDFAMRLTLYMATAATSR
jgi:hypothetical protein